MKFVTSNAVFLHPDVVLVTSTFLQSVTAMQRRKNLRVGIDSNTNCEIR